MAGTVSLATDLTTGGIGHRERKKARTRKDLAAAARRLTLEHGLDAVTVQQIADAADVSLRTFFNYFSSKEEAIVGVEASALADLVAAVDARPARERPVAALAAALIDLGAPDVVEGWVQRTELVERHPALLPAHLAGMAAVEEALALAVATRMNTTVAADPRPHVIVASAVAVSRAAFAWWMRSDRSRPLPVVLADAFAALQVGFRHS